MRLLVLGGTVFLGRHVTEQALARGHEVTLFTRGLHGAELFPAARHLRGDRTADLEPLRSGAWDAAIDTSGYEPEHVAASSALLADRVEHLVFVSTVNVYPDWPEHPVDEDSPVWTEGEDYGQRKAACERAAEATLPGRVAHVRPGLIVGPHDGTLRLPWWIQRIARGGDVVAPGDPQRGVQLIDARDLAGWMLDLCERRVAGTFNATAPEGSATMGEVLEAAVRATGSGARLHWVPDRALQDAGIEPWSGLPVWLPAEEFPGTWRVATARAAAAGLRCRPIEETIAGTWEWLRGGAPDLGEWGEHARPTGLTAEQEQLLLGV